MEADEMYQNAGEKGLEHLDAVDPPRRRANKRRGHGTWETDRPPIVGAVGRESGQVALTVLQYSTTAELRPLLEAATQPTATVNTDEWRSTRNHTPGHRVWPYDAHFAFHPYFLMSHSV